MRQGEWRFGIVQEADGARVLRTEHADGWFDLYEYTLEERLPVDYVVMNHYTSTHPKSSFIRRPVIQRAAPDARRTLVGERLTVTVRTAHRTNATYPPMSWARSSSVSSVSN
ncbi:arylamine N-acetyltransferase [Streptomyces sp. NPDC046925]|uniref:arylamine N-acetyltransferase n=1 Tax=Streptomyces sp. NPDC046925 TaxID=3155375 RepID=UPI0034110C85